MKYIKKDKLLKATFIFIVLLAAAFGFKEYAGAATYDDSGLVVSGSHAVVSGSEVLDNTSQKVTFTFKTTDPNYKGFLCGTYVIKYNPDRMDIDVASINQFRGMAAVNDNYASFPLNNQPAKRGMILVAFAGTDPSQDYDLSMNVTNLFKDGDRSPLSIELVNRSEDPLTVLDTADKPYAPATPIMKKATISLSSILLAVDGQSQLMQGTSGGYSATVSNALNNSGVHWSIGGATSIDTSIDSDGKLTIGNGETAEFINVIATSKEDGAISISKRVEIMKIPTISIDIAGNNQLVRGTKNNLYNATIHNATSQGVTWSIDGATSKETVVDRNGKVTVGIDEKSSSINLIATSFEDTSKNAIKAIEIIDKTYTVTNIEMVLAKIEANTSTTKTQLDKEIQRNSKAKVTILTNDGKSYVIEADTLDYQLDKEYRNEKGVLNEGQYNVEYLLDFPYIEIDQDESMIFKRDKTNVIGDNTVVIPLSITKNNIVSTPTKNTKIVKTADSTEVFENIVKVLSSITVFVYMISKKGRRKEV